MSILGLIGLVLLPLGAPSDSLYSISAVYTAAAPSIDGVVSDSVWSRAAVAASFIQYEPQRGQPSEAPTQAYLLYDETTLYVAFQLSDTLPPTAQLTRRDADLLNDDCVILVLDSFNDHQSAYYFMVNALGTQTDGRIANDGRTVDPTWDTTWQAAATVNPDFATIEADQEQINLTRFELSLPEKRPFFLEGAELFRQRIRTFYSRRISDITAGGRVLGKTGPWTLAFLGSRAQPTDEKDGAFYGVGRMQRDVGSSNVAVSVANRSLEGQQQGSAGLDATLFFTRSLGMTAQLVQSWGMHDSGTWAYFIRPALDTPLWHLHVRYTNLGQHFREHVNAVGFVRDDDRRELDSALERIFWIRGRTFERIAYDSNYNIYWSQEDTLRSWQIDQSIEIELRNRFSIEVAHREEFKRFEKDFRNRQTTLEIGYNTRAFQSAQLGYEFGRNFDADFQLWSVAGAYKVTPKLSLEYELQRLTLDPDPDEASTWIHVVRIDQFFTRDLFLRVFLQTNSAIDRRNVQAAFVYRYRPPFGAIQLAYQRGTAAFGERSDQGDTLFLKLTGVF